MYFALIRSDAALDNYLDTGREDAADSIAVTSLQEANSADQTRGSGNCEEQARDPGDTWHETRGIFPHLITGTVR